MTPLSVDEMGKLEGGFLVAPLQVDSEYGNTNVNCGKDGNLDTNVNCSGHCSGCSATTITKEEPTL